MPSPTDQPEPKKPSVGLQELAARAVAGDRGAFDLAVQRLSPGLARLIEKRTRDVHLAQELCQQAWAEVWTALVRQRYDPGKSALSTFSYAVAHKVWLRHVRSSGRTIPAEWAMFDEEPEPAFAAVDTATQVERVRACLRGDEGDLSDDERWILRSAAAGVSDRELAARLSIAPSSANARKQAALAKLREHLTKSDRATETAERSSDSRRIQSVRTSPRKEGEHG